MSKLVFSIGLKDADYKVFKDGTTCPYYQKWYNMLRRTSGSASDSGWSEYKDVKVCEEWLTFSNFKSWMETQDWGGKQLDKDLFGEGKLYSPETCCFLTRRQNLFLVRLSPNSKRDLPVGVRNHKGKYESNIYCHEGKKSKYIGLYNTVDEAKQAYVKEKLKVMSEVFSGCDDRIILQVSMIIKGD